MNAFIFNGRWKSSAKIYVVMLCLTFLLATYFIEIVRAQGFIQVDVRCAGELIEGLPPHFAGTIYRVLTPYPDQGNGRWELETITAQGSLLTDITVPDELYLTISPVETSPDGRYIVFQPVAGGDSLAVWDRMSDTMTSLRISPETVDYFNANLDPNWRQQRKIDWLATDRFVIRFFDLENKFFLNQLAEQVFTVVQNPLTIVAMSKQILSYPVLAFPQTEPRNTRTYSPQHTYVQALYIDGFTSQLEFRFQIYDAEALELVADFESSETFDLVFEPFWGNDESVLFLQYRPYIGAQSRITEINIELGFQESPNLLDTLSQTFGDDFRMYGLRPSVNDNAPKLLFTIKDSEYSLYAIVYNYEARILEAVCQSMLPGSTITGSSAYPVWGPDEDIIAYYDSGYLFTFDTVSGQGYFTYTFPFVGWVDTSVAPSPTETPTATFTLEPIITPTAAVPTIIFTNTFQPTATPTFISTPSITCRATIPAGDSLALANTISAANANGNSHDTICLAPDSAYTFTSVSNNAALPAITTPIAIVGNESVIERGGGT